MNDAPDGPKADDTSKTPLALGMGVCLALGTAIGIALDNLASGIAVGLVVGLAFGGVQQARGNDEKRGPE